MVRSNCPRPLSGIALHDRTRPDLVNDSLCKIERLRSVKLLTVTENHSINVSLHQYAQNSAVGTEQLPSTTAKNCPWQPHPSEFWEWLSLHTKDRLRWWNVDRERVRDSFVPTIVSQTLLPPLVLSFYKCCCTIFNLHNRCITPYKRPFTRLRHFDQAQKELGKGFLSHDLE